MCLERVHASQYGNDPINWRASPGAPSPGTDNVGNRPPVVRAGADQTLTITNLPAVLALSGSATDDGSPNPPGTITVNWSQVSGPATVIFGNAAQSATTATFTALGTYVLRLRASDGELESSSDVTITLAQATVAITFVPKASVWKYLDNGSDQGTAWRAAAFNDGSWKSGPGELGYGDVPEGRPEATVVSYGPDASNKYVTTYFRHSFSVTNAALVKDLTVNVMRDDGVVIYLNGTEVFRDNMPADAINYKTYAISAIGGADEATYYSQTVDPHLLAEGANILAVEIHQANAASSDISFDLELTGDGVPASTPPVNTPPIVSAGANQTIVLPNGVTLAGSVSDDGLPVPPGKFTVTWSKLSGPGNVTFSNASATSSSATFSQPGTYVLRLTASDGALQTTSDVTIAVLPNTSQPPHIDSVTAIGGATPGFRLTFVTAAGASYTIQFTDSLGNPSWTRLSDFRCKPPPNL